MNKFVAALTWLLGGLLATTAALSAAGADPQPVSQEPIPIPVWTVEDVALSGYANALAVDAGDDPHLLTIDPTTGVLRYAMRDYYGWHFEDVADESLDTPYLDFDLQIGPDKKPCLVYATEKPVASEPLDTKLVYGCRGEDGWALTSIEDGGREPRLAIDDRGRPHIALIQGYEAVYMTREGETWHREVAGSHGVYMNHVYLMLNDSTPVIVYSDTQGQYRADRGGGLWVSTPLPQPTIYDAVLLETDFLWLAVNDGEAAWGHPPFFLARLKLIEPWDEGPADWDTIEEAYDWQIKVDLAMDPHGGYILMAYLDPEGALQYLWWADEGIRYDSPRAHGDSEVSLAATGDEQFIAFADANQLKLAERKVVWFDNWQYAPVVVAP